MYCIEECIVGTFRPQLFGSRGIVLLFHPRYAPTCRALLSFLCADSDLHILTLQQQVSIRTRQLNLIAKCLSKKPIVSNGSLEKWWKTKARLGERTQTVFWSKPYHHNTVITEDKKVKLTSISLRLGFSGDTLVRKKILPSSRPVATGRFRGHCPPKFVVPRKDCFEHLAKTKLFPFENVFCHPKLQTWLRACLENKHMSTFTE